jgi:hypothetical protein
LASVVTSETTELMVVLDCCWLVVGSVVALLSPAALDG